MPASQTIHVRLEDMEPVKQITRALFRVLHEIEAADPALLPDVVLAEAERARAIVDEWRQPGRHARRRHRG